MGITFEESSVKWVSVWNFSLLRCKVISLQWKFVHSSSNKFCMKFCITTNVPSEDGYRIKYSIIWFDNSGCIQNECLCDIVTMWSYFCIYVHIANVNDFEDFLIIIVDIRPVVNLQMYFISKLFCAYFNFFSHQSCCHQKVIGEFWIIDSME